VTLKFILQTEDIFVWKFMFSSWILFEFRNTKFFHILLRLFWSYFCLSIFWRSFYTKILDIWKAIDIETCLLGVLHLMLTLKKLDFFAFYFCFYHYSLSLFISNILFHWTYSLVKFFVKWKSVFFGIFTIPNFFPLQ